MRYRRSRRHLRKTAEEPEKETYTDFELELDIPEDANHQQLVAKMPATNMSDNEEQVMPVSLEPWSRAPRCRQTRRPAYLNDYEQSIIITHGENLRCKTVGKGDVTGCAKA